MPEGVSELVPEGSLLDSLVVKMLQINGPGGVNQRAHEILQSQLAGESATVHEQKRTESSAETRRDKVSRHQQEEESKSGKHHHRQKEEHDEEEGGSLLDVVV